MSSTAPKVESISITAAIGLLGCLFANFVVFMLGDNGLVSVSRPFSTLVVLSVAALLLIFGVFWLPARAGLSGVSLHALFCSAVGPRAAWFLCQVCIPVALVSWFWASLKASVPLVYSTAWSLGAEDGSLWADPAVHALGIAAVVFVGLRGSWEGLGRSAYWFSKVLLLFFVGAGFARFSKLSEGYWRLARYPEFEVVQGVGWLLLLAGVPLMLLGHRLGLLWRNYGQEEGTRRLRVCAFWGIGVALLLVMAAMTVGWMAALGMRVKSFSPFAAFHPWPLGRRAWVFDLLIAAFTMLAPLRLAPRLLTENWGVRRDSVWGGVLLAVLLGIGLQEIYPLRRLLPGISAVLVGMAGILCGSALRRWLANRFFPGWQTARAGSALRSRMRLVWWVAAVAVAVQLDGLSSRWNWGFGEWDAGRLESVGIEMLVALLQTLRMDGFWSPDLDPARGSVVSWAFLLCAIGGFWWAGADGDTAPHRQSTN